MKADKAIATYRRMRNQPLWRLLASDNGPTVIGLLQSHLYDNDRRLPASIFYERISRDLEELRAQGDGFPQTAKSYIADWLAEGYLERRFPAGSLEEEYELSTAAIEVIRFISGIEQPHSAATESRLALVIQALLKLAEDTDADKAKRIERLKLEQERIDKEIDAIQKGQINVLGEDTALERAREIITLADELTGDFRRVRDQFNKLNRDLREKLINDEEKRGLVLGSVFAGYDMINDSEAGRTFSAFWRLLTDPEQSAAFEEALEDVKNREFFNQLSTKDKSFLFRMTQNLLEQGGTVHDVMQTFARSLKNYVQSREYLEHRRINQLLNEAQRTALSIKDEVKAQDALKYTLVLTSSSLKSLSQWALYDPALEVLPEEMKAGDTPEISLDSVAELVAQSEIDFRSLRENIISVLETLSQASICDILDKHPAAQGLGSVVGLIVLGSRHGEVSKNYETAVWTGSDEQKRRARIPKIYFTRESVNEFA